MNVNGLDEARVRMWIDWHAYDRHPHENAGVIRGPLYRVIPYEIERFRNRRPVDLLKPDEPQATQIYPFVSEVGNGVLYVWYDSGDGGRY